MNLEKVITRLHVIVNNLQASIAKEELNRLCRDIGHELPRRRLDILRDFRSEAACMRDMIMNGGNSSQAAFFASGMLTALIELAAAFEDAIDSEDGDILTLCRAHPYVDILSALHEHSFLTFNELSTITKISKDALRKPLNVLLHSWCVVITDIDGVKKYRLDTYGYKFFDHP